MAMRPPKTAQNRQVLDRSWTPESNVPELEVLRAVAFSIPVRFPFYSLIAAEGEREFLSVMRAPS